MIGITKVILSVWKLGIAVLRSREEVVQRKIKRVGYKNMLEKLGEERSCEMSGRC